MTFEEIPGSEQFMKADLVFLAMGFVHVVHGPLINDLGLEPGERGDIAVNADKMTSRPGVFAAGDCELGASLVVRAFASGRAAAEGIDRYLGSK